MNSKYLFEKLILVSLLNIYLLETPITYTYDNITNLPWTTIQVQEDTKETFK